MPLDPDFVAASQALGQILSSLSIPYAFIGGFAVNLLGSQRTTDDIDVEVASTNLVELSESIRDRDPANGKFSSRNNKLVFTPKDSDRAIVIEMLRMGDLGLPQSLSVIYLEGSKFPLAVQYWFVC